MTDYAIVILVLVGIVLALIVGAALLTRERRPRRRARVDPNQLAPGRHPPTSLALLLGEPILLGQELLDDVFRWACGAVPTHNPEDVIAYVGLPTATLATVQVRGLVLAILSLAEPYTHDRDWYVHDETPADMLSAWQTHRGWLSVDLVYAPAEAASDEIYQLIGKVIAEIANASPQPPLVVFRPGKRHAIIYDEETLTLLRRSNPLQVVTGPVTGLVLLRKTPRTIVTEDLQRLVHQAWHADVGSSADASDFAAAPKPPYGFVQYRGIRFGLMTPDTPYVKDLAGALSEIQDLRLRECFGQHRAWLVVDMVEAPVAVPRAEVYRLIARLIAEMIDAETLLLYAPELHRAVPITADLPAKLRGDNPLVAVLSPPFPPLVGARADDPRVAAAIAEARRRWPEFLAAFRARAPGQRFAIKRAFSAGEQREYMWVAVRQIAGAPPEIVGVLDNDPYLVKSLRAGSEVTSAPEDVVDWLYTEPSGKLRGNFTAPALARGGD